MLILENRATVILYNFLRSNIRSGKFLLPANVCPIVPTTFLKAGLSFDFIDIDDTHAMDQHLALKAIGLGGVRVYCSYMLMGINMIPQNFIVR